jgi:5-methylcytosine-specific restriction endonuclease McrA
LGRKLELDRKDPDLTYENLNNLVLACYWCNNAKTDTFTNEEFMKVGEAFKAIWQKRLAETPTEQQNNRRFY